MADGIVNIPPADPSTGAKQDTGNTSLSTLAGIVSAGKALVTETSAAGILTKFTDTLARFGVLGANGTSIASASNGVPVVAQTSSTWDVADRAARLLGALTGINGSGVATGANPVPVQLSDGSAVFTGAKTTQLPSALGTTSPALSISVTPSVMRSTGVVATLATTGVQIKATPGQAYYVVWTNSTGGAVFLQWYDTSSTPSAGDSPIWYSGSIASGNISAGAQGHLTEGITCPNTGIFLILSSTQATYTAIASTAFKYVVYYR